MMRATLAVAAAVILSACGGGGAPIKPADFNNSNFTGTWNNAKYGSTGAAKASITVNETAKTATLKLDLGGGVLGGTDPAEETYQGTYDATAWKFTGQSATFGALNISVALADGKLTGSASPTRGAFTFTGTVGANKIEINYTLTETSGSANGTLVVNKGT
jgi:hypothetical protein